MSAKVTNPTTTQPPKGLAKPSEMMIFAAGDRPLLLEDVDIFSAAGTHVARLEGTVAYDSSGRYVGTLVDNRLVFQDKDSLTFGPLFVQLRHTGFADVDEVAHRTLSREVSISE